MFYIVLLAIAKYDIVRPGGSYTITSGSLSLKPKPNTAVSSKLPSPQPYFTDSALRRRSELRLTEQ